MKSIPEIRNVLAFLIIFGYSQSVWCILVPIEKIPNTNLYTGINYCVSMKTFPHGWVTFTGEKMYIEVELDPKELPKYEAGQKFDKDKQWVFAKSPLFNGYTLTNRAKPRGFLMTTSDSTGGGLHVAIFNDVKSVKKIKPGNEWHKKALWLPIKAGEDTHYKLQNLDKRDGTGELVITDGADMFGSYLTWSNFKKGKYNPYIQTANDYGDDSIFVFEPCSFQLTGKMKNFQYDESFDLNYQNQHQKETVSAIFKFYNPVNATVTATFTDSHTETDTYSVTTDLSLSMMYSVKVETDLKIIKGSQEFSITGSMERGESKTNEVENKYVVDDKIVIPPLSNISLTIVYRWLNNVETRFSAEMHVTGTTNRLDLDHPMKTKIGPLTADMLEYCLTARRDSGITITEKDTAKNMVKFKINGALKGNFGIDMILDTKKIV